MSLKIVYTLFLLVFLGGVAAYGNDHVQVLHQKLEQVKDDNDKVDVLVDLAYAYHRLDPKQGKAFAQEALNLSQMIAYGFGEANACRMLGINNLFLGNSSEAIKNVQTALSQFKMLGDDENISKCYSNLGLMYMDVGEFEMALENFQEAGNFATTERQRASINNNLGYIYVNFGDSDQALPYLEKCLETSIELKDTMLQLLSLGSIAEKHMIDGEYELALTKFEKHLSLSEDIEVVYPKAMALTGLGATYSKLKDFSKAKDYFERALEVQKQGGRKIEHCETHIQFSKMYKDLDRHDLAIEQLKMALDIAKSSDLRLVRRNIYQALTECYDAMGNLEQGYEYYIAFKMLADSLQKESKERYLAELEVKYDLLNKTKDLEMKESLLEQERFSKKMMMLGLLFIAMSLIFFIVNYLRKIRRNKTLQNQKEELEYQKQILGLALNNSSMGVWRLDMTKMKIWINETLAEMLGIEHREHELEFDQLMNNLNEKSPGKVFICEKIFNGEVSVFKRKVNIKNFAQEDKWIMINGKNIESEKGIPKLIIGTCLDITELHEKEQKLEIELAKQKRALATNHLLLNEKDQLLSKINNSITQLKDDKDFDSIFKNISSKIHNNLELNSKWERFKSNFEQVHPDIFQNLIKRNPSLTANDLKHIAFLKMNLSNKEVADFLNISPRSVVIARHRLKKKLRLGKKEKLARFVHSL